VLFLQNCCFQKDNKNTPKKLSKRLQKSSKIFKKALKKKHTKNNTKINTFLMKKVIQNGAFFLGGGCRRGLGLGHYSLVTALENRALVSTRAQNCLKRKKSKKRTSLFFIDFGVYFRTVQKADK